MHTEGNCGIGKGECNIFRNCPALFLPLVQVVDHRPLSPVLEGHSEILQRWSCWCISEKTQECVYFVHTQILPNKHNIVFIFID